MTASTALVLAAIDGAVEDWRGSPDAARWHADGGGPDHLAGPLELSGITEAQFAAMSQMFASLGRTMQEYGRQMSAAMAGLYKPLASMAAEMAHAQDVRDRPRWHRIRCCRCNPAGNPLGDPVGRGYHRRQMARRRRRRR